MLINAGVRRIVFLGGYPDEMAEEMFRQAAVEIDYRGPEEG